MRRLVLFIAFVALILATNASRSKNDTTTESRQYEAWKQTKREKILVMIWGCLKGLDVIYNKER